MGFSNLLKSVPVGKSVVGIVTSALGTTKQGKAKKVTLASVPKEIGTTAKEQTRSLASDDATIKKHKTTEIVGFTDDGETVFIDRFREFTCKEVTGMLAEARKTVAPPRETSEDEADKIRAGQKV